MNDTGFRDATPSDDEALKAMMEVPMHTRGVWMVFQREPSFFVSQQLIATSPKTSVFDQDGKIIAVFSNGSRLVWLDGKQTELRYTGDMRISLQARGQGLMKNAFAEFKQQMLEDGLPFSQFIVLDGNKEAMAAVRSGKPGTAEYFEIDKLHTLTMTKVLGAPKNPALRMRQATSADIADMNAFASRMGQFYQALPVYDFSELGTDNPYYAGLVLHDFWLAFEGEELVGLTGIWNQKRFKQTVVLRYAPWLSAIRPFYNFAAKLFGLLRLPPQGGAFDYRMLHSLLCEPERLDVCDALIRRCFQEVKAKGVPALSFTLAQTDPRFALLKNYRGERLIGLYGWYSYAGDPRPTLNSKLIPFAEVGRI